MLSRILSWLSRTDSGTQSGQSTSNGSHTQASSQAQSRASSSNASYTITPAESKSLTLGQKQRRFTRMAADLIIFAYDNGYELTFGDAYRDPRVHGHVGEKKGYGSANSVHKDRLAIDLNLFKDGRFLTSTEDHRLLGEYWESLGGTWGGRFNDGNHYSLEHQGRK